MRDTLRSKIDQRMKMSQTNLEKMLLTRHSQSKSKSDFRDTTLSRIKSIEKNLIDDSFRKSQMYSRDSETFLNDKQHLRSASKNTSYSQLCTKTNFRSEATTKY